MALPGDSLLNVNVYHIVLFNYNTEVQYAISKLQIVRSGLHLITYLNVGNFCDQSTGATLYENFVQVFLRFSDWASLANIHTNHDRFTDRLDLLESENLRKTCTKTSCKVAPVTKVAHIL